MDGMIVGIVIAVALVVLAYALRNLIVLVKPNAVAVITGRSGDTEARSAGYRFISGGRTFRIPLIQEVSYLPLTTMSIPVDVREAPSSGYIPLNVRAIANVKIASQPSEALHAAAERLLGMQTPEMAKLAEETLTASLRGVLSRMTPEEVNQDREAFEREIVQEANHELLKLGFGLDNFKIQHISDNAGYLDAVGRVKTAEVIKNASIAEAERRSETQQREAEARRAAEVAQAQADLAIAEARNRLRVRQAELNREAETTERTAAVSAQQAEVVAQQQMESERIELQRKRLQADVVEPAEAARRQAEHAAAAEAAPIREKGRAHAEVLELLFAQIRAGGPEALQVFMAEKMREMLPALATTMKDIDIERLLIIDNGGGDGVATAANQRAQAVYGVLEGLAARFGVDLANVLRGAADRTGGLPVESIATAPRGETDGKTTVVLPK
jgi:flotillin